MKFVGRAADDGAMESPYQSFAGQLSIASTTTLPGTLTTGLSVATGLIGVALAVATVTIFLKRAQLMSRALVIGVLLWSAGQSIATILLAFGVDSYPGVGGVLSLLAAPLFTAGFVAIRGHVDDRSWVIRCLLDTLILAVAWLGVVWSFVLVDPAGQARAGVNPVGVAVVLMGLMVTATLFVVMTWRFSDSVRGAVASLSFTAVGVVAMAAPGTAAQLVVIQQLLTLLGWTMAVVTVISSIRARYHRAPPEHEIGPTGLMIAGVGVPLALLLIEVFRHRPDPVLVGILVVLGVLVGLRDSTGARQKRSLVNALSVLALRDPLTGLPNRRDLTDAVAQATAVGDNGWLLAFDVDRFKAVNTERGHTGGDAVLVAVAGALTTTCQEHPQTSAFRLGGDEFVILHLGGYDSALQVATRARELGARAAQEAARMNILGLTLSVGLAPLQPAGSPDPLLSLEESAQALRAAKEHRDVVRTYSHELKLRAGWDSMLERRLRQAVLSAALETYFQPIMHLGTERIAAFESLARWRDDELGLVGPDTFIPLAEKLGLIDEVGELALERSLELVSSLAAQGQQIRVCVNVSPVQLQRADYVDGVLSLLREYRVDPGYLTLEITENISLDPIGNALPALNRLAAEGITLAIDDFGIGYSSLASMTRVSASVIKIDRSLIAGVDEPRNRTLVTSLIPMLRAVGMHVVVEGIEDLDQARLVHQAGAEYGQGWVWSPAVTADAVPELLRRFGHHHVAPLIDRQSAPTA